MNLDSNRENALFGEALQLNESERSAFLDRVSLEEPALRARIEERLSVTKPLESTSFPDGLDEAKRKTIILKIEDDPSDVAVGQTIDRYKLLEKIGEGGFGVVYVADQIEPIRRRVAVKVIKLGMDTKQVVARFEAERQALAMMDHPNIAKVLDGGATKQGRPFFVMEFIRGIPITTYCDQNHLGTKQRLNLFIKVCEAIEHAHQKGIIHRDIKPSNILVTLINGGPVPKVIDFGIAKATEGRLTDQTIYTQLHQFIGTPAYISPEQAEMTSLDIDARTDIYSLGVVLYELLVGSPPFDVRLLNAGGLDSMRKTIREHEPPKPSTKLASLNPEEMTTTARRRAVEVPKLMHQIRGDLDLIAMKCLEKDRTLRYAAAMSLAADLSRHLADQPIEARRPSAAYKFRKAIARNKAAFAVAGFVLLTLLGAISFSGWQAIRAYQAEQKQQSVRNEADRTADQLNITKQEKEQIEHLKETEKIRADETAGKLKEAEVNLDLEALNNELADVLKDDEHIPKIIRLAGIVQRYPLDHELGTILLSELVHSDIPLPSGHPHRLPAPAQAMEISPKGQWLAVIASNHVLLADFPYVRTGLRQLDAPFKPISVRFSEQDEHLLVSLANGSARVFATDGTSSPVDLKGFGEHLQFTRDGRRVIGVTRNSSSNSPPELDTGFGMIWDARTGELLLKLEAEIRINSFTATDDGSRLAALDLSNNVIAWDLTNSRPIWSVSTPTKPDFVRFIIDGRFLMEVASFEKENKYKTYQEFKIFDSSSGKLVAGPMEASGNILSYDAWNPVAKIYVGWGDFGYDPMPKGKECIFINAAGRDTVSIRSEQSTAISIDRPGDWFSVATESSNLWVYDNRPTDTRSHGEKLLFDKRDGRISNEKSKIILDSRGREMLIVRSNLLEEVSIPAGELISRLSIPEQSVIQHCLFDPELQKALCLMKDGEARICDLTKPVASLSKPLCGRSNIVEIQIGLNGHHGLLLDRDCLALVVDINSGIQLGDSYDMDNQVTNRLEHGVTIRDIMQFVKNEPDISPFLCLFSPEGDLVAKNNPTVDGVLVRIAPKKTKEITLLNSTNLIWMEFSTDGKVLFGINKSNYLMEWDTSTGAQIKEPVRLPDSTDDLAISPKRRRVAVLSGRENDDSPSLEIWSQDLKSHQYTPSSVQQNKGTFFGSEGIKWLGDNLLMLGGGKRVISSTHRVELFPDSLFENGEDFNVTNDGHWWFDVGAGSVYITEMPMLVTPPPNWLSSFAEAVVGARRNRQGVLTRIHPNEFIDIRDRISGSNSSDDWHRWVRWLFADRGDRGPFPDIPGRHKGNQDGGKSNRPTKELSAIEYAGRALTYLENGPEKGSGQENHKPHTYLARGLEVSEMAAVLNPLEPKIWESRSQFWREIGNRDEEKFAINRALSLTTNEMSLWFRQLDLIIKERRFEDAGVPLESAYRLMANVPDQVRRPKVFHLVDVMRQLERYQDAAKLVAHTISIPSRSLDLPDRALDLTAFYNMSLQDNFDGGQRKMGFVDVASETNRINGTVFDLRGIVRLQAGSYDKEMGFSKKVLGIPVNSYVKKVHFLHGGLVSEGYEVPRKGKIGVYTVHCGKDDFIIPLQVGENIGDSWLGDERLAPVWPAGKASKNTEPGRPRLYELVWTNPNPKQLVSRIDFEGVFEEMPKTHIVERMWTGAPFLVAITVDY